MQLTCHLSPATFYRQIETFLLADEAAHNLFTDLSNPTSNHIYQQIG